MSIVYRQFQDSDSISEITRLVRQSYGRLAALGLKYTATWQGDDITRDRIQKGTTILAISNNEILGTITFEDSNTTEGCHWYNKSHVASFHQFATHPEFQGKGIGSRLLEEVEKVAKESGAHELALDTADRAYHLIAMYLSKGFRIASEVDWEDTNYKSLILSKNLSTQTTPTLRPVQHFQRDERTPELAKSQSQLLSKFKIASSGQERMVLASKLGDVCRALSAGAESLQWLELGISLAVTLGDQKTYLVNRLRLALAYQYIDRHDVAHVIFDQLMSEMKSDEEHFDFLLQHYAKSLVEVGEITQAVAMLEEAKIIRAGRQNSHLYDSTTRAIKGIEAIQRSDFVRTNMGFP